MTTIRRIVEEAPAYRAWARMALAVGRLTTNAFLLA